MTLFVISLNKHVTEGKIQMPTIIYTHPKLTTSTLNHCEKKWYFAYCKCAYVLTCPLSAKDNYKAGTEETKTIYAIILLLNNAHT